MLAFVRLPATGGVQRDSPSAGGLGVSPNLKLPQEWGRQGVEKTIVNDLGTLCFVIPMALFIKGENNVEAWSF